MHRERLRIIPHKNPRPGHQSCAQAVRVYHRFSRFENLIQMGRSNRLSDQLGARGRIPVKEGK